MLGRIDPKHFPALHDMTGERPTPIRAQSPETLLHNLNLWNAALSAGKGVS